MYENVGYGGKYNNLGHLGPIRVRKGSKTQEGSFPNLDRIDQVLGQKISKT